MLWRGADTVGGGDGVERGRSSDGRGCYEEGQMK